MRSFIPLLRSFLKDENGPTAVEYAVMLAAILLAVVGTVGTIGSQSNGMLENSNTKLEAVGFK